MCCAGHSPHSACKQCTTTLPYVHLHPLVCRKPFRRYGSNSRCSSGRKTPRALRTPVKAKVASFAEPEPYLDQEYSHESNAAYWTTRPVLVTKRTIEIVFVFAQWFLQTKFSRKGDDLTTLTNKQAERLRLMLTKLGPAFVKIGQAVSSRPDVTPPDYLKELEKLQDQIPAFDSKKAMKMMEEELGCPTSRIFSSLATLPTAAASLGQVYRGVLRQGGQQVAVKVQRPGVRESIALDIYILRYLAGEVKTLRRLNSDLPALLDEWATSLFHELDYVREAQNGVRFKKLYGELEGVYVPDMFTHITTQRVLVMEWIDGTRLKSSSQGGQGAREELQMVEIGVRCSLEQMLEEGYYHSDPHPGNLFKMKTGKLAYIDFGMMGEIQGSIRRGLIQATLHLVNREFDALADDFVTLGLLPPGSDKTEITPALTGVFQDALANGVNNLNFGDLSGSLGQTMYQYNFRIPPYYTLLVRSLSVLEGIALSADPNYKVLGAAYPWIARRLLTEQSPELRDTLRTLLYKKGRFQFARLESLLQQAARSPGRQSWKADGADQVRAATGSSALELLLGPEGEYVREIIIDELAKGIDAGWRSSLDSFKGSARHRLLNLFGVSHAAVQQGQVRSRPGGLLLEALVALPDLAGQEDKLQIDGINRLIKAMQEITSPTPTLSPSRPQVAKTTRSQPVAKAGNSRAAATSRNSSNVARTGNMQTASMRSSTPVSTSSRSVSASGSPSSSQNQATSSSSLDRSQAVHGGNAVETIQQAVQMLQWFVQEASQLPTAARLEALRIPLSLGNKVSSRLLARAARAWLAPGAAPLTNANGKPMNPDGTLAARSATRSASTMTDSPSAVALRTGSGNLTDNPTALGAASQTSLEGRQLPEEEEEDPFIKDTEDLVNSMQRSSPSWNDGNDLPADNNAPPSYVDDNQAGASTNSTKYNGQANSDGSDGGKSNGGYLRTDPPATSGDGRWNKDGSIDMVVFDKGESMESVQQSIASSNGTSRQ